jgi:signal transduction histidine kinase
MELKQNGCEVLNVEPCNNLTQLYFKNQKWFKNMEKFAFKQREAFISTVSHDLKIPTLAQIRALELLLNDNLGQLNDAQKEVINLTLNSCKYMYNMLSTILDMYKYENNKMILFFEEFDLLKLLDELFTQNLSSLKSKSIKINIKSEENTCNIIADKIQLKKALKNIFNYIILNSIKSTNVICKIKNKPNKELLISFAFESLYLTQNRFNEMFNIYSSDKMDKVGSSLELYLAKLIIEALNGNISVKEYNNKILCNIEIPNTNQFVSPKSNMETIGK